MILEEAIEIVTEWHYPDSTHPWSKMETALKLLIEAGKLVEGLRSGLLRSGIWLLEGESRE